MVNGCRDSTSGQAGEEKRDSVSRILVSSCLRFVAGATTRVSFCRDIIKCSPSGEGAQRMLEWRQQQRTLYLSSGMANALA